MRVLLIEDSAGDARLIREAVRGSHEHWHVEHCPDAESALLLLDEGAYDVVVVDQGLPGMSGLELAETARPRLKDAGLVMLTGEGDERLAVKALKSGFEDYVVKDVAQAYRELLPMTIVDVLRRREDRRARERAEHALRESEERYSLAVQGANDAIWDWDLRTDRLYLSPRWAEILGLPPGDGVVEPNAWLGRIHPDDQVRLQQDIEAHFEALTPHLQVECRVRHANGSWRWLLCRGLCVRDSHGLPLRIAGSLTDITERRLIEERLLHDAFHDPLTGLSNRAHFLDRLRKAVRTSHVQASRYAVLFLDMDGFKHVNDSLGHLTGDQFLLQIARRLTACAKGGALLARLGGDEFAFLLEGQRALVQAEELAQRIQKELELPFDVAGKELFASVSMGLAGADGGYHDADEVLRDADTAMYRAKAEARGSYRQFHPSMHDTTANRFELDTELRRAVDRGEICNYYQPIVSLATGRILGFEALARWVHPTRGLLTPDHFISAAEENGLILPLGRQVLRAACAQMKEWHARFPSDPHLIISVNISAREFADGGLLHRLGTDILDSGLPPRAIRLEMTESAMVASEESVAAKLWQIRALKVGISLDDFGTGYSSLAYLRHFPIDALKIDRSFVQGVIADAHDATIVRTVVQLAGSLGMDVTAEGVETVQQLEWLRALGCPSAQGYLFSPALDPEAAGRLLADDRRW